MTKAKHTPGPWHINSSTRIESKSEGLIASVRGPLDEKATHANARLIAAAPSMLVELEEAEWKLRMVAEDFRRWGKPLMEEELRAHAAQIKTLIAKAKGE